MADEDNEDDEAERDSRVYELRISSFDPKGDKENNVLAKLLEHLRYPGIIDSYNWTDKELIIRMHRPAHLNREFWEDQAGKRVKSFCDSLGPTTE